MNRAISRARVGLLIFVGVITFVVAIFLVGEKSQLFSPTFFVQVNFTSAEGVKQGAMVVLSGYQIGTVSDIQLTSRADSVRLLLRLSENVRQFIRRDSKAEIKQEGLVGNKIVNILIGSAELPPIENYGFIQGTLPFALTSLADNVSAITDTTKIISSELLTLLQRLNRGRGSIGKLLTQDDLYVNLRQITARTDTGMQLATQQLVRLAELLSKVSQSVDGLVRRADSTVRSSYTVTREIETLVHNLNQGKGTMGALLTDRAMYDTLITLISALTNASYDASNAADQAAQSIHAMRQHWLFGRVFAGEDFEKEEAPTPSYRQMIKELKKRSDELDRREERIREVEKKMGGIPKGNVR